MQRCEVEAQPFAGISELAGRPKGRLPVRVLLAYTCCALIWGTTWYAIRVCIAPGAYPTYAAAAIRFTLCATVLALLWAVYRRKITPASSTEARWISIAGLLSGVAYGLLYAAEEHISGGLAAVLSATSPLLAALIAILTHTERTSRSAVAGAVIAFCGVVCVFHDRLQVSHAQAVAVVLMLVIAVLNACSNVAMKRHARIVNALASQTIFFVAASTSLWVATAMAGQIMIPYPLPLVPTAALLYLTVFGTLVAFACFFYLLKHVRLSTAMTLAFVTPVIALGIDAVWEKQAVLTPETYLGVAIVIAGVAVSVIMAPARQKDAAG